LPKHQVSSPGLAYVAGEDDGKPKRQRKALGQRPSDKLALCPPLNDVVRDSAKFWPSREVPVGSTWVLTRDKKTNEPKTWVQVPAFGPDIAPGGSILVPVSITEADSLPGATATINFLRTELLPWAYARVRDPPLSLDVVVNQLTRWAQTCAPVLRAPAGDTTCGCLICVCRHAENTRTTDVIEVLKKLSGAGNGQLGSRVGDEAKFKQIQVLLRQARAAPLWAAFSAAAQPGQAAADLALPTHEQMKAHVFCKDHCATFLNAYEGEPLPYGLQHCTLAHWSSSCARICRTLMQL
jgi:hypothetical protein